jgi:hypothetical protein
MFVRAVALDLSVRQHVETHNREYYCGCGCRDRYQAHWPERPTRGERVVLFQGSKVAHDERGHEERGGEDEHYLHEGDNARAHANFVSQSTLRRQAQRSQWIQVTALWE